MKINSFLLSLQDRKFKDGINPNAMIFIYFDSIYDLSLRVLWLPTCPGRLAPSPMKVFEGHRFIELLTCFLCVRAEH